MYDIIIQGDIMEQLNRSELRKKIMTILYQVGVYKKNGIEYSLDSVIKEVVEIDNEFVKDTVYGVITYENELVKTADEYLDGWSMDRLGFTDQAILKLGLYELLYTETPDVVCINEAIELAKLYSDDSVRKMINGVMDKVYHNKK